MMKKRSGVIAVIAAVTLALGMTACESAAVQTAAETTGAAAETEGAGEAATEAGETEAIAEETAAKADETKEEADKTAAEEEAETEAEEAAGSASQKASDLLAGFGISEDNPLVQSATDYLAGFGITEDRPLVQSINAALGQAGLHAITSGTDAQKDSYEYEAEPIPPYILNMTEEEDRLISGELKGREYVNEYFGFRLSLPEGWSISDLITEKPDEALSIRKAYDEEYNCIFLMAENSRTDDKISILITGMSEDQRGFTEEDLIRENIELFRQLDEAMGDESNRHAENVVLAGKSHPASVESGSYEGKDWETTSFEIPHDPFSCSITVTSNELPSRVLLSYFKPV